MDSPAAWTIQDVVRHAGVSSRTLRHYDAIGLLPASGTASGGIRWYDDVALVRLQRILLLRELGLSLAAIADVLAAPGTAAEHLRRHVTVLEEQRSALDRRIAAVRRTIHANENGDPMTPEMFDGFDHTQYSEEVARRWGAAAQQASDAWWTGLSGADQADFRSQVAALNAAWVAAARAEQRPDGEAAQALAARHIAWLASVPGTPAATGDPESTAAYVRGLAELYVGDDRFRANYTGDSLTDVPAGPEFVRDALLAYLESGAR